MPLAPSRDYCLPLPKWGRLLPHSRDFCISGPPGPPKHANMTLPLPRCTIAYWKLPLRSSVPRYHVTSLRWCSLLLYCTLRSSCFAANCVMQKPVDDPREVLNTRYSLLTESYYHPCLWVSLKQNRPKRVTLGIVLLIVPIICSIPLALSPLPPSAAKISRLFVGANPDSQIASSSTF